MVNTKPRPKRRKLKTRKPVPFKGLLVFLDYVPAADPSLMKSLFDLIARGSDLSSKG